MMKLSELGTLGIKVLYCSPCDMDEAVQNWKRKFEEYSNAYGATHRSYNKIIAIESITQSPMQQTDKAVVKAMAMLTIVYRYERTAD